MSKPQLDRLNAAMDAILSANHSDDEAAVSVIHMLVRDHGAIYRTEAATNTLRIAGVTGTCTWSKRSGLLAAWKRNAPSRIMRLDGRAA